MDQFNLKEIIIKEINFLLSVPQSQIDNIINEEPMPIYKRFFENKTKGTENEEKSIKSKTYDEYCALKALLQHPFFDDLFIEEIFYETEYTLTGKSVKPDFTFCTTQGTMIVEVVGAVIELDKKQKDISDKKLKAFSDLLPNDNYKQYLGLRPIQNYREKNRDTLNENFRYHILERIENFLYTVDLRHHENYYEIFIKFMVSEPYYKGLINLEFEKEIKECNSPEERRRCFNNFINSPEVAKKIGRYSSFTNEFENDDYFIQLKETILHAIKKKFERYDKPLQESTYKKILLVTSCFSMIYEIKNIEEKSMFFYSLQDYICEIVEDLNKCFDSSQFFNEIFIDFKSYKSFRIIRDRTSLWKLENADPISFSIHQLRKNYYKECKNNQSLYHWLEPLIFHVDKFQGSGEHQKWFISLLQAYFFNLNYFGKDCKKDEEITYLKELSVEIQESIKNFIQVIHPFYLKHLKSLDMNPLLKEALIQEQGNLDKTLDYICSIKKRCNVYLNALLNNNLCIYWQILKIILETFPDHKIFESYINEVVEVAMRVPTIAIDKVIS